MQTETFLILLFSVAVASVADGEEPCDRFLPARCRPATSHNLSIEEQ